MVSMTNVSRFGAHYFKRREGNKQQNPPLVSPPTLGGGKS